MSSHVPHLVILTLECQWFSLNVFSCSPYRNSSDRMAEVTYIELIKKVEFRKLLNSIIDS